jgi:MFS family permease
LAEFFLHLVNASFFLILNIYLSKQGYSDSHIASYLSVRHLSITLLAFPFGLYVRGRKLLPFLKASAVIFPAMSLLMVQAIQWGWTWQLYPVFAFWGLGFFSVRSISVPYILRNERSEYHSEALALNFTAWSVGVIIAGSLNYGLTAINPQFFTEYRLLSIYASLGFLSVFFVRWVRRDELGPPASKIHAGDWGRISRALIPTIIIAVGAGLTIQFMNLFFFNVFGMEYDAFSLMGAATSVLATIAVLFVPDIKKRFGYKGSITWTQSLAVLALSGLAITGFFADYPYVFAVAIFLYALRQPLMNMANPMTSELTMYYVGDRNREMTSALTGAIWSGSWFFSSSIFGILRQRGVEYPYIFLIGWCCAILFPHPDLRKGTT